MSKFLNYIKDSNNILVITSRPLDFDCLGSGLLIKKYLESLKKRVTVIHPAKIKEEDIAFFEVLPYFHEVKQVDSRELLNKQKLDTLIFVDGMNLHQFTDPDSADKNVLDLSKYPKRVHIDHHSANDEKLGDLTYYFPEYSSATEIVLKHIVPEKDLTPEMATLGYAGIVGDTGNFMWNFTPQTLLIVSDCLKRGAKVQPILDALYFNKTKSYLESLKFAIEHTVFDKHSKSCYLLLSKDIISRLKLNDKKVSEIKLAFQDSVAKVLPDYPRAFTLHEKETNVVYISGRGHTSRNKLHLVPILKQLGGSAGGHFNAAGSKIEGRFSMVYSALRKTIKSSL